MQFLKEREGYWINFVITELFNAHILNMSRSSLHTCKKFQPTNKLLSLKMKMALRALARKGSGGFRETGPRIER